MTTTATKYPLLTLLKRSGSHCKTMRWDAVAARLWWADPLKEAVVGVTEDRLPQLKIGLPDSVFTLCQTRSGRLLLGLSNRLCVIDIPPRSRRRNAIYGWLAVVDAADTRIIISNGRADRDGNFVFGTRNSGIDGNPVGSFFQYSARHGLRRLALPTVVAASGICFSIDGTRMYYADETGAVLYRCRYRADDGRISDITVFAHAGEGAEIKDVMVDAGDHVWCAYHVEGKGSTVAQYGADGACRQSLATPDFQLSGIAVCGPGLERLMLLGVNGVLRKAEGVCIAGVAESVYDDQAGAEAGASHLPAPDPAMLMR